MMVPFERAQAPDGAAVLRDATILLQARASGFSLENHGGRMALAVRLDR
jgi:hypothetical protein